MLFELSDDFIRAPMQPKRGGLFHWIDASGQAMGALVRVGLVSSAAVAAALGQFLLAVILAIIALGLFVRLWRGRLNETKKQR